MHYDSLNFSEIAFSYANLDDLEHLFQLRHLGITGKFPYVYQMTKFRYN